MTDILALVASDFEPHLNEHFKILFEAGKPLQAELISVTILPNDANWQRPPFSVMFRTDQKTEYYKQAIYTIVHPDKGEMEIFLVPIGPDKIGMRYEAIFS